ncbi:MAG: phospholipase D-like domain-containing protein [bacterium]
MLAFMPPLARPASAIEQEYAQQLGVPVRALEATPDEQVRYLSDAVRVPLRSSEFDRFLQPVVPEFRPPLRGTYQPPHGESVPRLEEVNEEMSLTVCTSPDAGWPVLQAFLAEPVQDRLQVGIYQFTAPHIYKQIRRTLLADDDSQLRMTLDPKPEKIRDEGNKADDVYGPDLLDRLRRALGSRFDYQWMSVGSERVFASAYHIKVAVADGQRIWLSSGNWQSSNQPPYDPIGDHSHLPPNYLRSYNREHHVVLEHPGLARALEQFLKHDFEHGATTEEPDFAVTPDLFVAVDPELAAEFAPPRYFPPLRLTRQVRVQPLLTPDNYATRTLELIESASNRIYLQNQYINLNPEGDFPEFTRLLRVLLGKLQAGLDVRIICRDLMKPEKLDLLVALGFNPARFRFLRNTHTKVVILDGKSVLIGSHNWSNEGVVSNRDASLLFHDEEIAQYCETIFLYDWSRATSRTARRQPRVARDGETPFAGAVRMAWESVFDESPALRPMEIVPSAASAVASGGVGVAFGPGAPAAATVEMVVVNGINGATGDYLVKPRPVTDVADVIRATRSGLEPEVRSLASRARYREFGLLEGVDPNNLAQTGWGLVVRQGDPNGLVGAVDALLRHRGTHVPARVLKTLEYRPGEQVVDWLNRHGVTFGSVAPARVPFHLLLLGGPEDIPFEFQYLLDLEYAVGRLAFDTKDEYKRYGESVVRYETGARPETTRDAIFFAPQHAGDAATELSRTCLVDPLIAGTPDLPALGAQFGFRVTSRLQAEAKRSVLLDVLHGRGTRPAVMFTASHGMGFPAGDSRQLAAQGALLMQDWSGFMNIQPAHYVTAADIANDARLHGIVAFFFACYSAGTPQVDNFPVDLGAAPAQIAPKPFVAALPKRLLGHPNGGALGVFGHVERAWGYSIRPAGLGPQLVPFWNAFARIMNGMCLGNATKDMSERSASLSSKLLDALAPGAPPVSDAELVSGWIERNDARAYVLLGDPAARLRGSELV